MQSRRLSLSLFQHFRTILILTYISILYSRGGQTFLIAGQVRRLFFISGCTIHYYWVKSYHTIPKQNFFHPIFAYFFILDAFWYKMWCFLFWQKVHGPHFGHVSSILLLRLDYFILMIKFEVMKHEITAFRFKILSQYKKTSN